MLGGGGTSASRQHMGSAATAEAFAFMLEPMFSSHLAPGIHINDLHVIGQVNINTQKKLMIQKKLITLNLKKNSFMEKKNLLFST